jgi:hypothetical protein
MANNRLYIFDSDKNEFILLARSTTGPWRSVAGDEALDKWFEERDMNAAYGAVATPTELQLVTEYDIP